MVGTCLKTGNCRACQLYWVMKLLVSSNEMQSALSLLKGQSMQVEHCACVGEMSLALIEICHLVTSDVRAVSGLSRLIACVAREWPYL